ncbi:chemotaxis protein CheA [Desulfuromonas sp. TF]|uniref:chemotaxis protein CheA n=1 Tax=Desulfuromonas sp. TF TaxID=1232410 RepID=UPI00138B1B7F|nr:chemotaxis protein CheA [Desulfuromonas sp. TF]
MTKYREMFLSETREHLNNMSRLVITLEKDPSDREGIDSLFRDVHSIKGMAASMGYAHTAELAHHLEDLMDGFRKSGTVPETAVDRLLEGVDLLEGLLEDLGAEKPEREVADFLSSNAPAAMPQVHSPGREMLPSAAALNIEPEAVSATPGEEMVQVTVHLAADAAAPAARALLLLRELGAIGTIHSSKPDEEMLRRGGPVGRLILWLQTKNTEAQIERLVSGMADVEKISFTEDRRSEAHPSARREDASRTVRVRTDLLDRFINLTGELITSRYMLQSASREEQWPMIREGLDQLNRLIADLHHHVLQVRMMQLKSITGHLPRLVRDLCRKSGKDIQLRLEGEEVELDRAILEELADPLVHMVRNAVDHGIENSGEVTVTARREKDLVLLQVADNGRGMDAGIIRKKAVEKGLLSPAQAKALRERDLLQLVCHPGFSTAEKVTETSGRGVGMDVVKSAAESLGGTLEISSEPGRGTSILLKLPLSVAIIQVLLVECSGHTLAIPITRVLRTLVISREEIRSSGRQMVLRQGEDVISLLSLRKILRLPARPSAGSIPVVITEIHGRKAGLVVDRLSGQREVFVKSLAFPLDRLSGISGATVLGDGSVVFIIDPQSLLEELAGSPGARPPGEHS